MSKPKVSDTQLLVAVAETDNYEQAGDLVGLAKQTVKNRMSRIKQRLEAQNDDGQEQWGDDLAQEVKDSLKASKSGRYVITSAQNATPVHKGFWKALLNYCSYNDATLLVIPYRYKNPTSQWTEQNAEHDWWDECLKPYLVEHRIKLNKNLMLMGDIKMQPTAVNPLSGLDTISEDKSGIFGHPKLQLTTVATPQNRLPKILTTTGSCTQKNYVPAKAGKKGEFHHTFGAAVVEVDGDVFHLRQINAVTTGNFIDLNREYSPKGSKIAPNALAVECGDSHARWADPKVIKATFGGKGSILEALKPGMVILNDVLDFFSQNHHHRNDVVLQYAKHHHGSHNVEREIDLTCGYIDDIPGKVQVVIKRSNHDEALERWLKEADPKRDPENALFYHKTMAAVLESTKLTDTGLQTIDPFEYWAKQKLKKPGRVIFLKRDESKQVAGVEVSYHGDQGPNGARGSRKAFTKVGVKVTLGHSHSPGIEENVYQVGVSSLLRLGYNKGPSSWLQTHCVIYANGKRSLINIIGDKWKL